MLMSAAISNDNAAPQQPRYAVLPIALVAAVWLTACQNLTGPTPDRVGTTAAAEPSRVRSAPADTLRGIRSASGLEAPSDTSGTGRRDRLIWW